jgi:hypothetical protein
MRRTIHGLTGAICTFCAAHLFGFTHWLGVAADSVVSARALLEGIKLTGFVLDGVIGSLAGIVVATVIVLSMRFYDKHK